jgi:hypothetical protein
LKMIFEKQSVSVWTELTGSRQNAAMVFGTTLMIHTYGGSIYTGTMCSG